MNIFHNGEFFLAGNALHSRGDMDRKRLLTARLLSTSIPQKSAKAGCGNMATHPLLSGFGNDISSLLFSLYYMPFSNINMSFSGVAKKIVALLRRKSGRGFNSDARKTADYDLNIF